jgi:L-ascorbate metabolism protein UlaG (beta-lactamase superfamily)
MTLIKAFKKDDDLIREIDQFANDQKACNVWWLGQSGYLIQWNGKRLLLDPYLSDSLTKKYFHTDKPHTRISELVVDPSLLLNIDIVTSSHNHTDHLDGETLIPIIKNNADIKFIIPEANRKFIADRVNCPIDFPIGLNDNMSVKVDDFTFHGIAAKHNEIGRDEFGNCKYMGYVIEFGPYKIYHSGDTLWFDGMVELLSPFGIDVAFLPINGNLPERKVAGNLDAIEAAELGKAIGSKCIVPCHYDLFEFNTADVKIFESHCEKIGQNYSTLKLGERLNVTPSTDAFITKKD